MKTCLSESECVMHRYHVVHCVKGDILRIYNHSQGTWNMLLRYYPSEEIETYPSELYRHGMTAEELRNEYSREKH